MEITVQPPVYIALDVEAAGHRLNHHATISIGAALVTRTARTFDQYEAAGHVFYAELKPITREFEIEAMRVGCLHLKCLEGMRAHDLRYDPTHEKFDPRLVLDLLDRVGEDPKNAMDRFRTWIDTVRDDHPSIGVTDTVFFDGGHISYNFGAYSEKLSPFGWSGIDLDSLYRGYMRRADASLKELTIPKPIKAHRADHDAVFLAERTRHVLYELLNWS